MDEIIAQGIMFFPASYDTSSTAISFTLYNLALHPTIQETVCEEIENVTGDEVQ